MWVGNWMSMASPTSMSAESEPFLALCRAPLFFSFFAPFHGAVGGRLAGLASDKRHIQHLITYIPGYYTKELENLDFLLAPDLNIKLDLSGHLQEKTPQQLS
jgi:hypothetical protein